MDKPEALRLAEFYEGLAEAPPKSPDNSNIRAAAAELRRLHAQRDALLEALKEVLAWGTDQNYVRAEAACDKARAAIKSVEETE